MFSRSSNSLGDSSLVIGTVSGHRGGAGEITVRIASGRSKRWEGLTEIFLDRDGDPVGYRVEEAQGYRDRLVLKLAGVDDPGQAAGLKGATVSAPASQVPSLPEGQYYLARLIGMEVSDEAGHPMGRVEDVLEAGGNDVLVVVDESGREFLVPLVGEIVTKVDEERGRMTVRPPEGLRELNAKEEDGQRT